MKRVYLEQLRKEKEYSQEKLGKKIGRSQTSYASIENGTRQEDLSVSLAISLSKVLSIPISKLIAHEKDWLKAKRAESKRQRIEIDNELSGKEKGEE